MRSIIANIMCVIAGLFAAYMFGFWGVIIFFGSIWFSIKLYHVLEAVRLAFALRSMLRSNLTAMHKGADHVE
jgi:hypothetical protein